VRIEKSWQQIYDQIMRGSKLSNTVIIAGKVVGATCGLPLDLMGKYSNAASR